MVNTLKPTILHELTAYIERLKKEFTQLDFSLYEEKVIQTVTVKENMTDEKVANVLILAALERISMEEPDWTYVAADVYLNELYRKAADSRGYDKKEKYGSFYQLIQELTKIGIYNKQLLKTYTEEEINEIASVIIPERDRLFTYIGLLTLADRYLATSHDKRVYELPQERFLIIAMTLMSQEKKENRTALVKEAYWALSSLYMTVATPTLSNAGKSYGQLSSCFIDTIDDSLRGIYDSNTDLATLSKNGGGIGVYLGHIRSRGSDIKGFKGVSSGTIPWMKQLNNTAVSVDQLGQRQGAIAVYLDVWHKDIFSFLDARLNNGDERQRTHDLFTGVCLPDLFMEKVEAREDWHLFDPHEVRTLMGYSLEDFYDEEEGSGSFRT
ncbi:MAG: ribonucleotide reductase N-terminal alpha domain-containing protein, partial [Priestia megaterium]